jgi:hypothetical protein
MMAQLPPTPLPPTRRHGGSCLRRHWLRLDSRQPLPMLPPLPPGPLEFAAEFERCVSAPLPPRRRAGAQLVQDGDELPHRHYRHCCRRSGW